MKCKLCGKEFEDDGKGYRLYCSRKCKEISSGKRRRKEARKVWEKPKNCRYCGKIFMPRDKRNHFCQAKCQLIYSRTQSVKVMMVKYLSKIKELGLNFCWKCGYDENFCAIDIHHIDPSTKSKSWGNNKNVTKKLDDELRTCASLCARCHRIYHCEDSKTMSFIEWIDV